MGVVDKYKVVFSIKENIVQDNFTGIYIGTKWIARPLPGVVFKRQVLIATK